MPARAHARLTDEPLSFADAYRFCEDPDAGAVVVFSGTVRNNSDGRSVRGLTYEAYAERASDQLQSLAAQVAARPTIAAVFIEHRTGALAVGEPAVIVGVSSGHRPEAFEAARWAIDTLKETAAIWKQEHWADGGDHWPGLATP